MSAYLSLVIPVILLPGGPACPSAGDPLPAGVLVRMQTDELRKGGPVFAIAFSPDGKRLVSGSRDGGVRLWDSATGRPLRRFTGHREAVKAVVFAPDGKTLAAAGEDRTVRVWDVASSRELRVLAGHDGSVEALAYSPDGKLLASAGADKTVRLWDMDSGKEVRRLTGHTHVVHGLAFAPGGQMVASGSRDRTVRLWEVAGGKERRRLWTPGWVYAVTFSADGKLLASGGRDQTIHLWAMPAGEALQPLSGYEGPITAVAMLVDGETVVAGTEDHKVRLWQTRSHKLRRELAGHRGPVLALSLSPDDKALASSGADGVILLWELEGREFLWLDLGSTDESANRQAAAKLAAAPGSVAFLEERLRPLLELVVRVDRLIADLDSDRFTVRAGATHQLERMGTLAEGCLRQALGNNLPLETRRRIEQLLNRLPKNDAEVRYSERLRVSRALGVLEKVGSAEARRVLQTLAQGPPAARVTQEAQAALKRLGNLPGPP